MTTFDEGLELLNRQDIKVPVDSQGHLLCPVCGFEYVHPIGVNVNPAGRGGGMVDITADGVAMTRVLAPDGRGVTVAIRYGCEDGHLFELRFHFHKGNTEVSLKPVGTGREWKTIWRD